VIPIFELIFRLLKLKTMKKFVAVLLLFLSIVDVKAQTFMEGFDRFSKKKIAYLTLIDGTQVEGDIEDLDRKKGNISEITIKVNGKKKSFEPSQIKEMYLPATELDLLSKKLEVATNISKDLNMEKINEGYGFFENTMVNLKGKVQPLLMQLVNPGFSNKLRVYFNPWAGETMSVGIGPMKVGGIDKSYFIKKGDSPAVKYTKKEYEEEISKLFADCPEVIKTYGKAAEWNKLDRAVYLHASCK
jgi:hypothetical protein